MRSTLALVIAIATVARAEEMDCRDPCMPGPQDRCCLLCQVLVNAARGAPQPIEYQRQQFGKCMSERRIVDELRALAPDCTETCNPGPAAPCCAECKAARDRCTEHPVSPIECRAAAGQFPACRERGATATPSAPASAASLPALPPPGLGRDRLGESVLLCYAGEVKAAARATIEQEKHGAAYGGVVDKAVLYEAGQDARRADDTAAKARAALREMKVRPLPCRDPLVAYLTDCLRRSDTGWARDACIGEPWESFRALVVDE